MQSRRMLAFHTEIFPFQEKMKGRLQKAMPDVPLQNLREQREIHENDRIESGDEQEEIHENQGQELNDGQKQIHENQGNDQDSDEMGAASTNIGVQYNEENDVTFQCHIRESCHVGTRKKYPYSNI